LAKNQGQDEYPGKDEITRTERKREKHVHIYNKEEKRDILLNKRK
jgi:hypothetical protein